MPPKTFTARQALQYIPSLTLSHSCKYSKFLQNKYPVHLDTIRNIVINDQYEGFLKGANVKNFISGLEKASPKGGAMEALEIFGLRDELEDNMLK